TALAADGRGGAIAVVDDELATIDPAGNVSGRGSIHCREHQAVVAAGDDPIVICDELRGGDPSPVLRRIALTGMHARDVTRVPPPERWREVHRSGSGPQAAASGPTLWILTEDAIFYRTGGDWHTIAGGPTEGTKHKLLVSVPLELGLATRPSAPNGGLV